MDGAIATVTGDGSEDFRELRCNSICIVSVSLPFIPTAFGGFDLYCLYSFLGVCLSVEVFERRCSDRPSSHYFSSAFHSSRIHQRTKTV
jgi:hypothetical protein